MGGSSYIFLGILESLFWPVAVVGIIIFFIRRRRGANSLVHSESGLTVSKEDTVSQSLLLISVAFFGITILAFNKQFGDPLNWRTVVFIASVTGIAVAYFFKAVFPLVFSLLGLIVWWVVQMALWMDPDKIRGSVMMTGFLLISLLFYVLGYRHKGARSIRYRRFGLVFSVLGIIFVTVFLFFFSTQYGLQTLQSLSKGMPFLDSWKVTVTMAVILGGLIAALVNALSMKQISVPEAGAVVLLALLFGFFAFLPEQKIFSNPYAVYGLENGLTSNGLIFAVFLNILVFFEVLGLIFSGYLRREVWRINLGAVFLFFLVIVKYFDWFFTFLDKSVFFIGAGIMLFAIGFGMEKGRRMIISNIKTENTN